ncbi:MAG: ATP-binding protein [candidate division KSB1 bacterium]|nr:ATP-binding protein [candidate division KSB1 bacterium]MDZ7340690.1 ATP-binding protein [candidate division KSB1 bacterium]
MTITLDRGAELPARLDELEKMLRKCFNQNQYQLILNMEHIKLPPARFIVILIEATSQARRMGGDLKLINLSPSVRNNLVTFSPRTYLSITSTEAEARSEFGETFDPMVELDNGGTSSTAAATSVTNPQASSDPPSGIMASGKSLDPSLLALANDRIRINSKVENLYQICDFVLDRAQRAGFDIRERGKIKVTVYEACLNVIEHAYFSNPDNLIHVAVGYDDERLVIIIQDWGASFQFDPTRPYDVEKAVQDRRTGGFGLHIIRRSVDEIHYLSDAQQGNRLILVKKINNQWKG